MKFKTKFKLIELEKTSWAKSLFQRMGITKEQQPLADLKSQMELEKKLH